MLLSALFHITSDAHPRNEAHKKRMKDIKNKHLLGITLKKNVKANGTNRGKRLLKNVMGFNYSNILFIRLISACLWVGNLA